jgi:hypothetical protein
MAAAAKLLQPAALSLFSASLSLRRLNPRATMLQSLCAMHAAPSAASAVASIPFVHLLSGVATGHEGLVLFFNVSLGPSSISSATAHSIVEQAIKSKDLLPMHMLLSSDLVHSNPNSPPPSHAIVLYSNIM